eukprot:PhM_4_TR13834/c0_g1_i1/m.15669
MHIYKCLFTNQEVLCDNNTTLEVEDDVVYVMKGKYVTKGAEDFGISANVDEDAAEGATAEGAESGGEKVIDVVDQNRLSETAFDKASFLAWAKGYMKDVKGKLEESNPDRVAAFQAGAQTFIKKLLGQFDEYQFFMSSDAEGEGIVIPCIWEGETAKFLYFKDGLKAERV